jgi:hypothetical protein
MGARTAGLVSLWCAPLNKINSTAQVESRTFNLLTDWLRTIIHWVIVTSLTSALMCLFCAQLWPIDNVIQKVQANLIAGPIVLFLVTPASLIVLAWIILTPTWPPRLLCDFLEWGLSLFHQAALTFSERGGSQNEHQLSFPRTPLESEWFENPYLSLLFIITALSMAHWFHQALRAKLNNIGH